MCHLLWRPSQYVMGASGIQRRRDALAPVRWRDSQIINVDFNSLLLELLEFVCGDTAHDRAILQRCKRDEIIAAEQALEIGIAWPRRAIGLHLVERLAEGRQHGFHQCHVVGRNWRMLNGTEIAMVRQPRFHLYRLLVVR